MAVLDRVTVTFGTSGLRGLVVDLTDDLIARYVRAFLGAVPAGQSLYVGADLRPSSPRIASGVCAAACAAGVDVVDCGAVSTPALALAAMQAGASAIMVTGSHIPADRNGLKFYRPTGEISKIDEGAISAAATQPLAAPTSQVGRLTIRDDVMQAYIARYVGAFGPFALQGLHLGVYQHSSVARDALVQVLQHLGANVTALARADEFFPVDTESVDAATRAQLVAWAQIHEFDAILSADGDGDRPLMTDAQGMVIAGDILGVLTAQSLEAQHICTPVSSNSMIEEMPDFHRVSRCKIGSPHVIAAIQQVLAIDSAAKVVGFEANGGFLLGYSARGPAGILPDLTTRDAVLPMLAPLVAARAKGINLRALIASLPTQVTAADRISPVDSAQAAAWLDNMTHNESARSTWLLTLGLPAPMLIDLTDGLRMLFTGGRVLHLRPSGNAPEFRVYVEADHAGAAQDLLGTATAALRHSLSGKGGK